MKVYAGTDPLTGREIRLRKTCRTERAARIELGRLLAQAAAGRRLRLGRHRGPAVNPGETTIAGEPAAGEPAARLQATRPRPGHDRTLSGCRPHVCTPMAKGTIRRIHAILSGALEAAMRWEWMDRNPAVSARPPTPHCRTILATSPEDVAKVIAEARARSAALGLYLWLVVVTGVRRGELRGVQIRDVDLKIFNAGGYGCVTVGNTAIAWLRLSALLVRSQLRRRDTSCFRRRAR